MPIHWVICPPSLLVKKGRDTTASKIPANTWILPCLSTIILSTGKCPIKAARPMIRPVSAIIEPIAFPKARSGFQLMAARTETVA